MIATTKAEIRDRWRLLDPEVQAAVIREVVPRWIRRSRWRAPKARSWPPHTRSHGLPAVAPTARSTKPPTATTEGPR